MIRLRDLLPKYLAEQTVSAGANASSTNPNNIATAAVPGDFDDQFNWWTDYINSDNYLMRLKKEFPNMSDEELNAERDARVKNLKNIKSKTRVVNSISDSGPGYILGLMIPKNRQIGTYIWDFANKEWIPDNKPYNDPKGYDDPGHLYFEKGYGPGEWNPDPGYETIPGHELSHAVDDGGSRIPDATIEKIFKYTSGGDEGWEQWKSAETSTHPGREFDYYSTPTEFIARLQAIRYLLKRHGIWDASKDSEFTEWDYYQMKTSPEIFQADKHYQDVFKSLKGTPEEKQKSFIDLMNTIAVHSTDDDKTSS